MNEYFYNPPPPPPGARGRAPTGLKGSGGSGRGGSLSAAAAAATHPYQRPPDKDKPKRNEKHEKQEDASDEDEGTLVPTIQVDTSDVDKWIAERRKNWPSNKRVAEKEAEKQRLRTLREAHERLVGKSQKKQSNKPLCKYFVRGKCGNGDKCKFSHVKAQDSGYKRYGPPKKVSLFTRLVQNDMDKENDKVLDFVVYLNQRGVI